MTYQVTYKVERTVSSWFYGEPDRVVEEPLSLDLNVDEGVGGCCAVGMLANFFVDDEFKRHPADHHYVTVQAIKEGCKELIDSRCSLAYATINTEQTKTEACLLEAGFVCQTDGWAYRNPKHPTYKTGVKVFIKPLHKVLKRIRKEK